VHYNASAQLTAPFVSALRKCVLSLLSRRHQGDPTSHHELVLGPNERPFLDGDGVDNWDFLATGGTDTASYPSARTEIIHAAQATGSNLLFQVGRV